MKKLKELLKSHENLSIELAKLIAERDRCQQVEARILSDGKVGSNEVSELNDARTTLELILRRLPILKTMIRTLDGQIKIELHREAAKWDATVADAVKFKQAQIVAALEPFYSGEMNRLKEFVRQLNCPAIYELRRAAAQLATTGTNPCKNFYATNAKAVLESTARNAKKFGLALPD